MKSIFPSNFSLQLKEKLKVILKDDIDRTSTLAISKPSSFRSYASRGLFSVKKCRRERLLMAAFNIGDVCLVNPGEEHKRKL